jgi:hypothetical protein
MSTNTNTPLRWADSDSSEEEDYVPPTQQEFNEPLNVPDPQMLPSRSSSPPRGGGRGGGGNIRGPAGGGRGGGPRDNYDQHNSNNRGGRGPPQQQQQRGNWGGDQRGGGGGRGGGNQQHQNQSKGGDWKQMAKASSRFTGKFWRISAFAYCCCIGFTYYHYSIIMNECMNSGNKTVYSH